MPYRWNSIRDLRAELASAADPAAALRKVAEAALACANGNTGKNSYLWRNESWTLAEASRVSELSNSLPLWGIPVSVKDCFDLAGSPTSCGTRFYRDLHGTLTQDSWLVKLLRDSGAVITGKTHLHPLAYGITGENPEFGDCRQPGRPSALTGGSSSGAAASILEGSAAAAIGTDTGGSIRVPAALCGIAGYRASLGRGNWRGAAHLAQSFDTLGWLFRSLEDGPLLGSLFGPTDASLSKLPTTFAVIGKDFLHDCEPAVVKSLQHCRTELQSLGLSATEVTIDWWHDSLEIFAAIQASEAASLHQGHFNHFEASIQQRLNWGAGMSADAVAQLRLRHSAFVEKMDALLAKHQLLLLPAAPVTKLAAGADHSQTRTRLLRYTSPISLAGMPAVTIPFLDANQPAGGMQLIAAREDDPRLLAVAAKLGAKRKSDD